MRPRRLLPPVLPLALAALLPAQEAWLKEALAAAGPLREAGFADLAGDPECLAGAGVLVWDTRSKEPPGGARDPAAMAAVRRHLDGGGGLLLLSFAAAWLHDLGLEPVPPDRMDTTLQGHSDHFGGGRYDFGVKPAERDDPLFRGLAPAPGGGFFLAGAHTVRLEACLWERARPAAKVLATFHRDRYGEVRSLGHATLLEVHRGRGRALALGLGGLDSRPGPWRGNLDLFLRNCLERLRPAGRPGAVLLPASPARLGVDEYASPPPSPAPRPHWSRRAGPGLPLLAHWGWLGPVTYQRGGKRAVGLDYFKKYIIDESAPWGANLLEFYPPCMDRGYPIAWGAGDPAPRPEGYWGGGFEPLWPEERMRELTAYAHGRGLLVHAFFHPNPVRGPWPGFLAFAERSWRELGNPLRDGPAAAWDGMGSEWWPADREADLPALLWKYQPGAYQHSTSILPAYTPNFSGTLMCAFGRLGRINACGLSAAWRDCYHPPLYLSSQADCRTRRPAAAEWGVWSTYGGGGYPDWLLRQANDFCRPRLDRAAALWWLGEPEATLHPEYRGYVYGISMEPIRAAVACALWATGRGGYRETAAALSPDPPPGFAAGPDLPCTAYILQNDFLRLCLPGGPGGSRLLADPARLARFDPGPGEGAPALAVAASLVESRWEGWEERRLDERVILLGAEDGAAEGRGEGAYESIYRITGPEGALPRRLAAEAAPAWPQELALDFAARAGAHELTVGVLPGGSGGVVEVRLDGDPIGFYLPKAAGSRRLAFGVARPGPHRLSLSVQSGPGHELDFLAVRRVSNLGTGRTARFHAGNLARIEETVGRDAGEEVLIESRTWTLAAGDRRLHLEIAQEPRDRPGLVVAAGLDGAAWAPLGEAGGAAWAPAAGGRLLAALRYPGDGRSRLVGKRWEGRPGGAPLALGLALVESREEAAAFAATGAPPLSAARTVEDRIAVAGPGPLAVPVVLPLRRGRGAGPGNPLWFVREPDAAGKAWWTARGAQQTEAGQLLRLEVPPGGEGLVLAADYLPCGLRPAWGCQHVLAFRDAEAPGRSRVRVERTGPFLFAPRVESAGPVARARLDGRDWRYLEDRMVYLPNHPGECELEVEAGFPAAPALARTRLTVHECAWDGEAGELRLATAPPELLPGPLPGGKDYTAMVLHAGWRLQGAEGAEPIPWEEYRAAAADRERMARRGFVVRLKPGRAVLRFAR